MRKLLITSIIALSAFTASAQISFSSNTFSGTTHVAKEMTLSYIGVPNLERGFYSKKITIKGDSMRVIKDLIKFIEDRQKENEQLQLIYSLPETFTFKTVEKKKRFNQLIKKHYKH